MIEDIRFILTPFAIIGVVVLFAIILFRFARAFLIRKCLFCKTLMSIEYDESDQAILTCKKCGYNYPTDIRVDDSADGTVDFD